MAESSSERVRRFVRLRAWLLRRRTAAVLERVWSDVRLPAAVSPAAVLPMTLLLAAVLAWGADTLMTTPQEAALRSENRALRLHLAEVETQMTGVSERVERMAAVDRRLYRTLLRAEPISREVQQVGVGGTDPHAEFAAYAEPTSSLMKTTAASIDQLERKIELQNESYRELVRLAERRDARLSQLPALLPADGPVVSGFGLRHHPVLNVPKLHEGIDVLVPTGTAVVAAGNGVVQAANWSPTFGNYIEISHPAVGLTTRYAHLSQIMPSTYAGAEVRRGQRIGLSGNTGRSTAPHVHFEVIDESGRAVDPIEYVAPTMTPARYAQLRESVQRMFGSLD